MASKKIVPFFLFAVLLFPPFLFSQDSAAYVWNVTSKKMADNVYELTFSTTGNNKWQLYGANEILSDVPSTEIIFDDSAVSKKGPFKEFGNSKRITSKLFDGVSFNVYEESVAFTATISIDGKVPAKLLGKMNYTYGKDDELYPSTPYDFSVALEGGVESQVRIKVPGFDLAHPVSNCGDESTGGKSLAGIFLLGLLGGFIALLTPCVFPLIPLTVSFFTKQSQGNSKKGIFNAVMYGFFIFLIYLLLSLPFHLLSNVSPEILNNISTNVYLNILFFLIFVFFAFSFFGYFEIGLPGGLANKIDSRSGMGTIGGIFFMALTLAIVSFSCTGPILGSLLAGTASEGAWPLTAGLAGFGLALALPFALFAMFPDWLKSLPKSGGWLTSVKVVLGFLELAMAIKFLSNADLVEQWGIVKREIFIATWVITGILIVLYLLGVIKFPHDGPVKKIRGARLGFIVLFASATIYLIPGLTNSRSANLALISGFPPPMCYSIYASPVNCETGIEPLRDYNEALALAKMEHKPILIDFTGWACVNCRRMEENVWTNEEVSRLMKNEFVVVSLYVDERKKLAASDQINYVTKTGADKKIITVGDKWATFQSENFNAVSQPQYAIIHPDEKILTKTKGYTPSAGEFAKWLKCGVDAYDRVK
ncbi:MAG: cytochrome c biogenesis protein CcdA [Flavitalea sp.]